MSNCIPRRWLTIKTFSCGTILPRLQIRNLTFIMRGVIIFTNCEKILANRFFALKWNTASIQSRFHQKAGLHGFTVLGCLLLIRCFFIRGHDQTVTIKTSYKAACKIVNAWQTLLIYQFLLFRSQYNFKQLVSQFLVNHQIQKDFQFKRQHWNR